jgi:peptidase E
MTTFYLGGGYNERDPDIKYHKLLAKYANNKILYLGFANPDLIRRREKMEELFTNVAKHTSIKVNYDISSEVIDSLTQELVDHNIWVIGGGLARIYVDVFAQILNLQELLKEKIIFGSSAGAVMWGHHYYETDEKKFTKGLGILPYNFFVHYKEENKPLVNQLRTNYPEFPTVTLAEHQHKLIELLSL